MTKKFKLAAACVVALAAVSAQAQSQVAGTGLYVGGSAGLTKWHGNDAPGLDDSKTGGKIYGGYEFTPNIALELGWAELGKFNFNGGSYKPNGPYLDAVGKFPFGGGWSGLARVGLFQGQLKRDLPLVGSDDDHGTGYKVGAGVQYDITQNVGIRTEYERYKLKAFDQKPSTDLLSVGVNYKF